MRNITNSEWTELTMRESTEVYGGNDVSEKIAWGVGWVIGSLQAIGESWMNYQTRMAEEGYKPVH
jgi:hypothetical protein